MKYTLIILAILLAGCFRQDTDIKLDGNNLFEVKTYIFRYPEIKIVASKYNWMGSAVTLDQLDSVRKEHDRWADTTIKILKKVW